VLLNAVKTFISDDLKKDPDIIAILEEDKKE
jgi:hypothetical protein